MYAFIPDSGFVGTAFINGLSNTLSRIGKNSVLSVELGSNCRCVFRNMFSGHHQ
jgi:hypothetical protein